MAKAYFKHDYVITGKDYVETEGGGDTPAGGINYSIEEQDTGLKWIDGKSIYAITVVLDNPVSIPQNTATTLLNVAGYNIDTLVDVTIRVGTTGIAGEMCYIDTGTNNLIVNFHQAWIVHNVTLLYTKTE